MLASPGENPELVARRSDEAGNHQLPHVQAGTRRAVLRPHLWPGHRLGVSLRQVQAHEASRRHLRQVRRGSDGEQGAPRAHGPHRAGVALFPRLVLQGTSLEDRTPARHLAAGTSRGILYFESYVVVDPGDAPVREREIIKDENTFRELDQQFRPSGFKAMMGAEAHQGAAEARQHRRACDGTARADEDRNLGAEEDQVRQAAEGGGGVPQEQATSRSG